MSEARAEPQRRRPTLDDVLRTLRVHLPELREHYRVRTLGVFGSYVRGEQRPRSDLDLLVEFDARPLTLIQVITLEQHLSDLLGVQGDLVEKKTLKTSYRPTYPAGNCTGMKQKEESISSVWW
jgi:uncharacterized protein